MKSVLLSAQNLRIGYKKKKENLVIADGISFELQAGDVVALLGENGAGKSTLIKSISGVLPLLSGNIFFDEISIDQLSPQQRAKKVSLVLTESLPENDLSVREVIELGRQPYTNWLDSLTEKDQEKVNWAAESCGISDLMHLSVHEISSGQRQNVFIARALAQDTSVVILDEPSNHLDLKHKIKLYSLLNQLGNSTQKAVLFSTHDLDHALQFANKVMIITKAFFDFGSISELNERKSFQQLFHQSDIEFDPINLRFNYKNQDNSIKNL